MYFYKSANSIRIASIFVLIGLLLPMVTAAMDGASLLDPSRSPAKKAPSRRITRSQSARALSGAYKHTSSPSHAHSPRSVDSMPGSPRSEGSNSLNTVEINTPQSPAAASSASIAVSSPSVDSTAVQNKIIVPIILVLGACCCYAAGAMTCPKS